MLRSEMQQQISNGENNLKNKYFKDIQKTIIVQEN